MSDEQTWRDVLVHLNVEVPRDEQRSADEVADAVIAALVVGLSEVGGGEWTVSCGLAEDVDAVDDVDESRMLLVYGDDDASTTYVSPAETPTESATEGEWWKRLPGAHDAERCADCGEPGESVGHMGCQYPGRRSEETS